MNMLNHPPGAQTGGSLAVDRGEPQSGLQPSSQRDALGGAHVHTGTGSGIGAGSSGARPMGPASGGSPVGGPPPSRRGRLLLAGFVLVAAGLGAWWYVQSGREPAPATASAEPELPPGEFRLSKSEIASLKIEPVRSGDFVATSVADGRIAYNDDRSTPVYFPYNGGRVVQVDAKLGDTVQQGQPLFEVESADLVTAANTLFTALDAANKSRAAADLASRQERRSRSLYDARAASVADVETARAGAASAAADVRSADATVAAARDALRVLGRSPAQIADMERTRQINAVVPVAAPLSGVVTQRKVGPGQWLSNGGDPVFTISDLSTMWLVANVREMDVPKIRLGQPVVVTVGALPGRTFDAKITSMASGLDPTTRRLTVRAEVQDPEHLLKPEMFATFRIAVGNAQQGISVPTNAIIYHGSDANVWISLPDGVFALRPVQTGIRSGDFVEIVKGLQPADKVVTGGALFVDRAARID